MPRRHTDDDFPRNSMMPLFRQDSLVILTARELASTHSIDSGGYCPRCDEPSPCQIAKNAHEVCAAAGY